MSELVDKIIILMLSCGVLFFFSEGYIVLVCMLTAISISSLLSYFQNKKIAQVLLGIYFTVCFVNPVFCFCLPLIYYDIFVYRLYLIGGLGIISLLQTLRTKDPISLLYVGSFIVFSCWMKNRSKKIENLEREIKQIRDNGEELQIILQNKNKDLLEKQEYEIHMATLKERNRIAREIHDNVGHLLSRSILQVGAIMAINKEEPISKNLGVLKDTLSGAMDSIRNSVHNLHDDSIDLQGTVENMLKDFPQYKIQLDYDMGKDVDKSIKYCFITTIKEALSNMVKHSNATNMRMLLREHPGFFQLLIEDNGTKIRRNIEGGMGLENMRERVQNLKGTLDINVGQGFRIFISIPKEL